MVELALMILAHREDTLHLVCVRGMGPLLHNELAGHVRQLADVDVQTVLPQRLVEESPVVSSGELLLDRTVPRKTFLMAYTVLSKRCWMDMLSDSLTAADSRDTDLLSLVKVCFTLKRLIDLECCLAWFTPGSRRGHC